MCNSGTREQGPREQSSSPWSCTTRNQNNSVQYLPQYPRMGLILSVVSCFIWTFSLLECIYWHTLFSRSTTPSASLVHWGRVALHTDSNSKVPVHKVSLSQVNEIQEEQERFRKTRPENPWWWAERPKRLQAKFCNQLSLLWAWTVGEYLRAEFVTLIVFLDSWRENSCSRIVRSKPQHQLYPLLYTHFTCTLTCCLASQISHEASQIHIRPPEKLNAGAHFSSVSFLWTVNQGSASS